MGIVLSGVFLANSVEKHHNMQIIKGLLLVESTIKIAGPLQENDLICGFALPFRHLNRLEWISTIMPVKL